MLATAGLFSSTAAMAQDASGNAAPVNEPPAALPPMAPPAAAGADGSTPAPPMVRDIDYVGVLGNYVKADRKRGPDVKYGSGASFLFGRHFANHWGWEANYTFSGLETGPSGGGDYYLQALGADATYSFGDRQTFTPFLLAGGGGVLDDVHPRIDGGGSGYVNVGLGFTTGTFWHERIRVRAEVRGVHDFNSTPTHTGFNDVRAGIGIEIPFYEPRPVEAPMPPAPPQVVKVEEVKTVPVPTGVLDSDGDGVTDDKDKCPNTPPNTRVDGDGCPIPKVLRLDGVTFEFNKARLRPDAQTILGYVVGIMQKYPDMQVELAGYTDNVGKAAYNLRLSQKRAEAVKMYLVGKGIGGNRIAAKGYGKENPVATNDTDEGRERNRRVELHVLN